MALRERKLEEDKINTCLLVHNNPQSAITEQYRNIRNNIRFALGNQRVGAIVVTSPSDGEGKSTAAVNLAISFAQHGERVLLADANIRNPILNQVFNMKLWPGLTDGLANHTNVLDNIQETPIEKLSFLPGGSFLVNAADLLDSQAMTDFLESIHDHYDVILFDCSSVLQTPDAIALAGRCNGAVLVIDSGKTHQARALEAKRRLDFGNVRLLGAVLNKKRK